MERLPGSSSARCYYIASFVIAKRLTGSNHLSKRTTATTALMTWKLTSAPEFGTPVRKATGLFLTAQFQLELKETVEESTQGVPLAAARPAQGSGLTVRGRKTKI